MIYTVHLIRVPTYSYRDTLLFFFLWHYCLNVSSLFTLTYVLIVHISIERRQYGWTFNRYIHEQLVNQNVRTYVEVLRVPHICVPYRRLEIQCDSREQSGVGFGLQQNSFAGVRFMLFISSWIAIAIKFSSLRNYFQCMEPIDQSDQIIMFVIRKQLKELKTRPLWAGQNPF